ncbi:putative DnaJ domain, Chaperone J-domain superfamily [Helianthus annuus]|nr:putative DnaJ domain, Chaperone J-domain superfamily [Helianthus annuus]
MKGYRDNGAGGGGYGARSTTVYDDVFGGPPKFGATTLPPRLEDYTEIFQGFHASRGSSIPVLDLPPPCVDSDDVWFDVRSSKLDYSEVFGGFNGLDFALSYEELFDSSKVEEDDDSSDDVWTPAQSESLSDESDPQASLEMNQQVPNADLNQSSGVKLKSEPDFEAEKDFLNGTTNDSQCLEVSGSTVLNNQALPSKKENEKFFSLANNDLCTNKDLGGVAEGKKLKKSLSQSTTEIHNRPLLSVSDLSLKTQPSNLPPPSRPPPALTSKKGDSSNFSPKLKTSKSYAFERTTTDQSPPFFDVEIDASSSAAADAAAMKDAVEQAQAKLRSAKAAMDRKKEGLQSRSKMKYNIGDKKVKVEVRPADVIKGARELENERLRKIEEENERENERLRIIEEENERENERLRKIEEENEREKERLRKIEEENERENERLRKIEEENERENERLRKIEEENEREKERLRKIEEENEREKERLRKIEEEREKERFRKIDRELENERVRKLEEEREIEKERLRKIEREQEDERLRKIEEERERQIEREKDRMAVDRATLEAREKTFAETRERAAVERATAEFRQRALAEARERLEKACAEARERSLADKAMEGRLRVEKATAEARERAVADKFSIRQNSLPSDLAGSYSGLRYYQAPSQGGEGESPQRCKARLERHQRTADRAAKALAEKNMRDLIAQKEQAERSRLAEGLDAEVKRWSSGKQGNLRALLSTLQYILGPDSGWQPVPLTEVITTAAVKKAYRKATLCVHPDKLQQRGATIQQKYICEKVFDLLKEAWNKFNSEER